MSRSRSQGSLVVLLGIAGGLLGLLLAAALAPARALPQPIFELLDYRRDFVLTTALALGFGIAVGLFVVTAT